MPGQAIHLAASRCHLSMVQLLLERQAVGQSGLSAHVCVCVCVFGFGFGFVCACACVCVYVCACACVCVDVWEKTSFSMLTAGAVNDGQTLPNEDTFRLREARVDAPLHI